MGDTEQIRRSISELAGIITRLSIIQMKELMNETGLSHSQMISLMQMHIQGCCGVSQIAEHLGTSDAASSQLVQRLVNLGLVERVESQEDRRAKKVSLTPKGKDLVERVVENRREMIEEMVDRLPVEKQLVMIESINLLLQSAREYEKGKRWKSI